ncbi:helix-turn-helix domain-containing protein [Lacticaseibacillus hegangensis]|uniref:Transposase n=1 Tax=Lacticaseibacillus hegangensis TaxID=2486010 RepID=A0ABW4D139_9LACO|nr:helix-turn-helix domain-containing protein [Lacticaseibacillus hegangensis]
MTKYSSNLRAKVVGEYRRGGISMGDLCIKYGIGSHATIQTWLNEAEQHGLSSLRVKHRKTDYSVDTKVAVVEYVQTHETSRRRAAAHFGISPSQVNSWVRIVQKKGVAGLRPKPKGRHTTSKRKNKKNGEKIFKTIEPTKEEQYQQEIIELKRKLHEAEMNRDILKVLATMTENSQTHSPRK